jgi:hypothetical protein
VLVFEGREDAHKRSELLDIRVRMEYQVHGTSLKFPRIWKGSTDFFIMSLNRKVYCIEGMRPPRHPVTASTLRDTEKETCCIRVKNVCSYGRNNS